VRHLRTVWDTGDKDAIERILLRTQALKRDRRERRLAPTLSGRVLAMLFEQESTRTRASFEAGVALLGGSSVVMQARDTQLVQGEPLRDAARVFGSYCDALMVRTIGHDVIEEYARHAAVGLLAAAALCGFELRIAAPEGHDPDPGYRERAAAAGARVTVTRDVEQAVAGAQVVLTDRWATHDEDARAALAPYQLNAGVAGGADDDHLVLHPLPAHRGEEITDDVLEGRHSVVFQQAANRLPMQQALLEWLLEVPVL
jgi:ornithine carbamoyltransferase